MGLGGRKARLGGVPGPHLAGGADRVFLVEHRRQALRVLLGHVAQYMLDDNVDVECDQDPPPKRVGVEQRRDVEAAGVEERLDNPPASSATTGPSSPVEPS